MKIPTIEVKHICHENDKITSLIDPVSIKRNSPIISSSKVFKRTRDNDNNVITQKHDDNKRRKILQKNDLDKKHRTLIMVSEYNEDIFKYLYNREKQIGSTFNYMKDEESPYNFGPSMRAILIEWLIEVHEKFHYVQETLILAIAIMDKFLSQNIVTMSKLQLLAVTSLFIASKFEEINLPKLSNFAYITDGAASINDIKIAEAYILKSLKFDISIPNPLNFFAKPTENLNKKLDKKTIIIARYLLEHIYCCPHFIDLKPSQTSQLALFLAREINANSSNKDVVPPSKDNKQFWNSYEILVQEISKPSTNLNVLFDKYRSEKYHNVYEEVTEWCSKKPL
ncbi:similar to Saccharomyces cerevisiae YGR109C CLB6 B-type cyclin involved in DNA replication during S phase [Maudiozyma saulgeensis]|uniref:Similar to Saccharomyces cerevisiae YGR109C CLB6 B-type cyclin involved in DNA replication during S phase n=1 Tax=Maudiozyma saulgeensis TaxID=1789683 RepID=A0A1X7QY71_9SACH|nr:similar to Saccharomyces cerevisiae YGR109C CLB6 B-type cyclin involved in DNA replication during S phase [Kazachstania saulgeensis]